MNTLFTKTAMLKTVFLGFLLLTISFSTKAQTYDFIVAQDGSGNFKTVQAAIDSAPINRTTAFRIFIKNGKYKEKISISTSKPFIHLIGESVANVILTYDDYSGKLKPDGTPHGTSSSASVTVNANDFLAANITFENTTGDAPQALAINLNGDRCVIVNCRFLGGQDTVLANGNNGNRQYFKNCYIDGTVDFIFGSAKAVFDSCTIYGKDRLDRTANSYITAANTQAGIDWGYVFRNCTLLSNRGVTNYFLGRPWQNDGTTTPVSNTKTSFLNCKMGQSINAAGWSTWNANTNTALIFYGEYKTTKLDGSAYNVGSRVTWSKQISDSLAKTYVLDTIFLNWKPSTVSTLVNAAWTAPIVVTNFAAAKGTSTTPTNFTWNASWGITGVKYELLRSTDNKATFSKIYEVTATNDTAIVFGTTDTIPSPNKSFFYIVRGTKTGLTTHISDTIEISSIPTITVSNTALNDFLQGVGLPSASKVYTLSAVNLLGDVKITPPANYEISLNGTTWSKTPLSISPLKNEIAKTNIFARLNATAAGTYNGDILNESTNAQTIKIALTGKTQTEPLPISNILLFYPFVVNNQDSASMRDKGVVSAVPTFRNMSVSNGLSNASQTLLVPYSAITGQAISPGTTGEGLWTTASGGPGGTLNRSFFEQFTITAADKYRVRLDSFILNSSYFATSSNTRLAFVYSRSGFASDSTDVTGGIGPDGLPLASTAIGSFAAPIVAGQDNLATVTNYRLALNGTTGVTLQAGQTLTLRIYFSCGSTSAGRYAKLKDVHFKGFSVNTTSTKDLTTPSVFSLQTNPVSDILTINHKNIGSAPTFTVYNMNGAVQFSKKAGVSDSSTIDTQSLAKGLYLIECVSAKEKVVLKFVKQ